MTESLNGLLGALVGAPSLPGARCRGKPHLFDEQRPDEPDDVAAARHTQALGLCSRCPSLDPCERWFESLRRRERPAGVIAGRLHHWNTKAQGTNRETADDLPA